MDTNNEVGAAPATPPDTANMGEVNLVQGWANFDNGTGNRKDWESDVDGPNMRDFYHNNASNPSFPATGFFTSMLNHNCLGQQDDGSFESVVPSTVPVGRTPHGAHASRRMWARPLRALRR